VGHILAFISAGDESRCLFRLSDLEEWVPMDFIDLAFLAEIEVRADTALVSDSLNWLDATAVTSDSLVHLLSLISSLLAEVVNHKSLEGLGCVGLDLLLDNLDKIEVKLVLEVA
jgi:hypothetical protein